MDFKFSKDSEESQHLEAAGEKKSQRLLLVLLLILVGGFSYLYFFTALIKPLETQKATEPLATVQQSVKIPLPSREGGPGKIEGKTPEKAEPPKPAVTTAPVTIGTPAVNPAPPPASKPVPAPSKPKEEVKSVVAAKPTDKKPQPVPIENKKVDTTSVPKAETKKPSALAKKPAEQDKMSVSAKSSQKKQLSGSQEKPKSLVKTNKATSNKWSLIIGDYVLEEPLSSDMGRVRKAGFEPIVKPSTRKQKAMNRLLVADFKDRASAQSTIEKLKRLTSDAFVIEQGGRFAVFAGSYLQSEAASSERERLMAAGFTTTIKHVTIAIPSQSLSVGSFESKKAADAALGKLRDAGIKATLSQK